MLFYREDASNVGANSIVLSRTVDRLLRMDKTNPETRGFNSDDRWLKENANKICKIPDALKVITYYGWLEETFWSGMQNPDLDIEFQKLLIDVQKSSIGWYRPKYLNLLFNYIKNWDFVPEVKKIIFSDIDKYGHVLNTYKILRDINTGKLLKE